MYEICSLTLEPPTGIWELEDSITCWEIIELYFAYQHQYHQ
jgi:hypothetical protein